jgi:ubiquinone/menaquinone biosynthesis C-methylase UbiE
MRSVRDWRGARVLDVGCGTGYHLPRFAADAGRVIGVEPHHGLAARARQRCSGVANVEVRIGTAERLPVPDASVDVAHARWAYFFGPGCEAGLAELDRVMRAGGTAFVIDNDITRSTFGRWFRKAYPHVVARDVEAFSTRGWRRIPLTVDWQFEDRAAFEAVVRIEFPPDAARRILAAHAGTSVDYAVNLWTRSYGRGSGSLADPCGLGADVAGEAAICAQC